MTAIITILDDEILIAPLACDEGLPDGVEDLPDGDWILDDDADIADRSEGLLDDDAPNDSQLTLLDAADRRAPRRARIG